MQLFPYLVLGLINIRKYENHNGQIEHKIYIIRSVNICDFSTPCKCETLLHELS